MKSIKLHRLCVCASTGIKKVSWLKNNFVENVGKLLFLKTSQFHYIPYNIYYYLSMIFISTYYYLNLSIYSFLLATQVSTTEHFGAKDVGFVYIRNVTSEHFRAQLSILVQPLGMI